MHIRATTSNRVQSEKLYLSVVSNEPLLNFVLEEKRRDVAGLMFCPRMTIIYL